MSKPHFLRTELPRWLDKTKAQEVHVAQVVNADGDSCSEAFVCGAFLVYGVHMCMVLRSPCMAPHEYKVPSNIGKRNCNFLEELCKFVLVFFPMLHST